MIHTLLEERLEQLRRDGYERQQIRRDPPPPPSSRPPEPEPDTLPRGIAEVTLEMVSWDVFAT